MLTRFASVCVCACVSLSAWSALAQMSADKQVKVMNLSNDFDVTLFASEPFITNPAAIDVDTHGRVWVAEIQWYRSKAKNPPADKIKVLEDTDGDGVADKVTTFADGVFCPMSVCVAGDKVYVATSPDLWVYDDKNGDLKADGPPRKLLTGFGGHNSDHGAHSLVLGPDHKWYMAHGDTGCNVTGTDGSKMQYKWGAVVRGELDGSKLETVAVNFRNTYECCVSSFGEIFLSDNDNDGNQSVRICWIMSGGNYGWFGSPPFAKGDLDKKAPPGTPFREHWHFRGHIPGNVPATICTGFGSPCGICYYEGDVFGLKYKNVLWHAEAGPAEIRIHPHELAGFGMKGTQEVIMKCGDRYFRPTDVCAAPDGSLYVSDWYDGGVGGHGYNDPDRGRIFRLTPKGKKVQRKEKPGPYTNIADAIEGLKSPNLATQYLARERLLAEKEKAVPAVKLLLGDAERNNRARALWVLDRIGGSGRQLVLDHLHSADATFRALAVRILRQHGPQFGPQILALANDSNSEVVREVLLALQTLKGPAADAALVKIAKQYDGNDRYLLEELNLAATDRKEMLYQALTQGGAQAAQIPLLQLLNPKAAAQILTAKLTASGTDEKTMYSLLNAAALIESPEAGKSLLQLVTQAQSSLAVRKAALERLAGNLSGSWKTLAGDEQLISAIQKLLGDKDLQLTALAISGENGLTKLTPEIATLAKSATADGRARLRAVKALAQLRGDSATETLRSLLTDKDDKVREAALDALVDVQDGKTLRDVLSGTTFSAGVRAKTCDRLMESTGGALTLLKAVEEKKLSADLQKTIISKAAKHADANVRSLFEKFIPENERPKKLGDTIKAADILALSGNPTRGEEVYGKSSAAQCKNCHVINGKGTNLGPDLSNIGSKYEKGALLETILEPSKAIAPEYYLYVVETQQGQTFAGFLVDKNDKQVVLKDAKNQTIRIPAADVEQIVKSEKSMMPELVLRDVTAQDAADLLAYLLTLNKPASPPTNGKQK